MSGERKRPAEEQPASEGAPADKLGDLAEQIDYFERLAQQEGDQQEAKKPAKVRAPDRGLGSPSRSPSLIHGSSAVHTSCAAAPRTHLLPPPPSRRPAAARWSTPAADS